MILTARDENVPYNRFAGAVFLAVVLLVNIAATAQEAVPFAVNKLSPNAGAYRAPREAVVWSSGAVIRHNLDATADAVPGVGVTPPFQNHPALLQPIQPGDRVVGKVYFVAAGVRKQCTGTLVGPALVLTAGHCVHPGGSSSAAFHSEIEFVPGYPESVSFPGPPFKNTAREVIAFSGWVDAADNGHDVAFLRLSVAIPSSVHPVGMGVYSFDCNRMPRLSMVRLGYTPQFSGGERQYATIGGSYAGCYKGTLWGTNRTGPGSSGSGSFHQVMGYVLAVHSAEDLTGPPYASYDAVLTKAKICFALRQSPENCGL